MIKLGKRTVKVLDSVNSGSPFLNLPIRDLEQAKRDIERARQLRTRSGFAMEPSAASC